MSRRSLPPAAAALLASLALLPAAAHAIVKLPEVPRPVADNPAERLVEEPIEESYYEPAKRCTPNARRAGMDALQAWLEGNAQGVVWGVYRCERWGKRQASLHAEKRALDWHLDVTQPADKREAERLIRLLLAPDSLGNAQALARRMGVEEIIWDCGYWGAGLEQFTKYSPCFNKHGRARKKVDPTVAHRDHVHFGMTMDGAMGRTSYWRSAR